MSKATNTWKKGRGKLGILSPLLGSWVASGDSPMGKYECTRVLQPILSGSYIQLTATWKFATKVYEEHALLGIEEGVLTFWSFTSDGKNSRGKIADATDVHAEAIGFEAQMPAGLARMVYWPHAEGGFNWAVESKTKKGWNRFTLHHYEAANN